MKKKHNNLVILSYEKSKWENRNYLFVKKV